MVAGKKTIGWVWGVNGLLELIWINYNIYKIIDYINIYLIINCGISN